MKCLFVPTSNFLVENPSPLAKHNKLLLKCIECHLKEQIGLFALYLKGCEVRVAEVENPVVAYGPMVHILLAMTRIGSLQNAFNLTVSDAIP